MIFDTLASGDEFESIRREAVENRLLRFGTNWVPEEDWGSEAEKQAQAKAIGPSNYRLLLDQVSRSAMAYAVGKNLGRYGFDQALENGLDVVENLLVALTPNTGQFLVPDYSVWHHHEDPIYFIKKNKIPYIENVCVKEGIARRYLDLPFRCEAIDRLLVDVLIAIELYQFGYEMFHKPHVQLTPFWDAPRSPFKRYTLPRVLAVQAWIGGGFLGLAILLIYFADAAYLEKLWRLYLGVLILSVGMLIVNWMERRQTLKLLQDMRDVYSEVGSHGPTSARRVREEAARAARNGVVWPEALFALLDDIISRSGRF